jgi:hypothetical protein
VDTLKFSQYYRVNSNLTLSIPLLIPKKKLSFFSEKLLYRTCFSWPINIVFKSEVLLDAAVVAVGVVSLSATQGALPASVNVCPASGMNSQL